MAASPNDINSGVITNPTLLIDDQLLRDSTTTITTLVVLLALTLFLSVACCSGFMWFKCRGKSVSDSGAAGGGSRGAAFVSSSASSMSSEGINKRPLPSISDKQSDEESPAKISDFRRVFSIRLPAFDFFDKKCSLYRHNNKQTDANKHGVCYFCLKNCLKNVKRWLLKN